MTARTFPKSVVLLLSFHGPRTALTHELKFGVDRRSCKAKDRRGGGTRATAGGGHARAGGASAGEDEQRAGA